MNKIFKVIRLLFNTLTDFSLLNVVFRNVSGRLFTCQSDLAHLEAAMDWMKRSQDASESGGCSGVYTFESGWKPPYPETTGYIIQTFIEYGNLTSKSEYLERALKMGDWEINIQLSSGAVRGGVGINEYPIVFNTGMVMLGWVALYKKTQIRKYLDAAEKASEWLVKIQDTDGKWNKHTFNGIPHSYNSRVAWALMEVAHLLNNSLFQEAAEKNVRWVLAQADEHAWFDHMDFAGEKNPWTHTIAYTLRGLLECYFLSGEDLKQEILGKVVKASEFIMIKYETASASSRMFLPGAFTRNWEPDGKYSCLTGNVQMAIIWMKLFQITSDRRFLNVALKNIEQVKSTQDLQSRNDGIRGGIGGSYPIWGRYVNFGYPNWAAKFFADAIMLSLEIQRQGKV